MFKALLLFNLLFVSPTGTGNLPIDTIEKLDCTPESRCIEKKLHNTSTPCDTRIVIGIDPDNLRDTTDHWDVFSLDVFHYCDDIGIAFQCWSGNLGQAEIGMCGDGIWVDLSKYQSYGHGYLLCNQNDWKTNGFSFKFVPSGDSKKIIPEIKAYFGK